MRSRQTLLKELAVITGSPWRIIGTGGNCEAFECQALDIVFCHDLTVNDAPNGDICDSHAEWLSEWGYEEITTDEEWAQWCEDVPWSLAFGANRSAELGIDADFQATPSTLDGVLKVIRERIEAVK